MGARKTPVSHVKSTSILIIVWLKTYTEPITSTHLCLKWNRRVSTCHSFREPLLKRLRVGMESLEIGFIDKLTLIQITAWCQCIAWTNGNTCVSWPSWINDLRYNDVIMCAMACQITSLMIVYSSVYSGEDQTKHQRSASLAFVPGTHQWSVNSPHKCTVTRKCFHLVTSSCLSGDWFYPNAERILAETE